MEYITLQEVTAHTQQFIHKAEQGEEIIVTENDKPIAKISSVVKEPFGYGSAKGEIYIADDFDETPEDFKEYVE
ncbi:MAG: type II toxin-antitoxin system prevent-host-death family antitoxin [Bacteroidota bacterium]